MSNSAQLAPSPVAGMSSSPETSARARKNVTLQRMVHPSSSTSAYADRSVRAGPLAAGPALLAALPHPRDQRPRHQAGDEQRPGEQDRPPGPELPAGLAPAPDLGV